MIILGWRLGVQPFKETPISLRVNAWSFDVFHKARFIQPPLSWCPSLCVQSVRPVASDWSWAMFEWSDMRLSVQARSNSTHELGHLAFLNRWHFVFSALSSTLKDSTNTWITKKRLTYQFAVMNSICLLPLCLALYRCDLVLTCVNMSWQPVSRAIFSPTFLPVTIHDIFSDGLEGSALRSVYRISIYMFIQL